MKLPQPCQHILQYCGTDMIVPVGFQCEHYNYYLPSASVSISAKKWSEDYKFQPLFKKPILPTFVFSKNNREKSVSHSTSKYVDQGELSGEKEIEQVRAKYQYPRRKATPQCLSPHCSVLSSRFSIKTWTMSTDATTLCHSLISAAVATKVLAWRIVGALFIVLLLASTPGEWVYTVMGDGTSQKRKSQNGLCQNWHVWGEVGLGEGWRGGHHTKFHSDFFQCGLSDIFHVCNSYS